MAWERVRFGDDRRATRERLRSDIQHQVDDMAGRLRSAAETLARDAPLIEQASADRDALPQLFAHVDQVRRPHGLTQALGVYVTDGTGGHRLLAWSEGPAQDLAVRTSLPDAGARPMTTVVPSTLGLHLVVIAPVSLEGKSVGLVTADALLSPASDVADTGSTYRLSTALGDVMASPAAAAPRSAGSDDHITVSTRDGQPLLEVTYAPSTIERSRAQFRGRVLAGALLPLLVSLALLATTLVQQRFLSRKGRVPLGSLALSAVVAACGLGVLGLARLAGLPDAVGSLTLGVTTMLVALALPVSIWWRGVSRHSFRLSPARAMVELFAGGSFAALVFVGTALAVEHQFNTFGFDQLASPLFPFDTTLLLSHLTRLALAVAAVWSVSASHASLMERWRIHWHDVGPAAVALAVATVPAALLPLMHRWGPSLASIAPAIIGAVLASGLAGMAAGPLRRRYRRASQSTRLLMLFAATVLPALVIEPIVSMSARRATDSMIETVHAPATVGHAAHLQEELTRATVEIDQLGELAGLVARRPGVTLVSTDAAFDVWTRTGLARGRLTSSVELYGPDGRLTSRFALNVPELGIDQSSLDIGCNWDTYGEVGRFGADDVRMLHAERGVCDAQGTVLGAVVLHVIFDYRSLPYLAARNPYDHLLRDSNQSTTRNARGIQVAVYGWSRLPLFVSGGPAWPIDLELLHRLERSRTPFWTTRSSSAGTSRVYFLNDRSGIYALAYPIPTMFALLARLSETVALGSLVFLVGVAAMLLVSPGLKRPHPPLRAVVQEVRTSFYRKLFLFFVLTAIVPVLALALTFSRYMGNQLRSDVETEAVNAVTVARRVLEDTMAVQQLPLTDDVLVWISRVISQDVNVYEGARLRATSQRDLFDSGILPERTPARAYRAIALDHVPAFVEEQHAGGLTYLVAAAPLPGLGRSAVLSVPLAPRQQQIEQEISDLNRGVLFGALCVIMLAAGLGARVAQRVANPVSRLTRATRQIAAGRLDVRIVADTADELRQLVTDFNTMAATLQAQRAELGRVHELKAWADVSRQVAHDIKNPLTPIQLAAEHLQRVHADQQRPLGATFDQCLTTIFKQIHLLRQIANEFANFAVTPVPTFTAVDVQALLEDVVRPYRIGLAAHTRIRIDVPAGVPLIWVDTTLLARALTNLVENALQAMPDGGVVSLVAAFTSSHVTIEVRDQGIGMAPDALARAFDPHFSTKTGGSGLGLANARRNIESCAGTITATSTPGRGTTMRIRLLTTAVDDDAHGSSPFR